MNNAYLTLYSTACDCNQYGSVRSDCEQVTGNCVCIPSVTGIKCNQCLSGTNLGPNGCTHGIKPWFLLWSQKIESWQFDELIKMMQIYEWLISYACVSFFGNIDWRPR